MKNKIKEFAKGNFQMNRPDVTFSDTHLMIAAGEGELYQGSFLIQNEKDGDIRGIVYPSSFRVHVTNQGFEGNPVEVKFVYDTTGMIPGQVEKGKFTVVCNGGEYEICFTAIIEKPFVMTPYGKVQTVHDFKKLAMQDFTEAKRLFRTRQFYDILKYEEDRVRNLYVNMRKWALDEQALEEFLVGIKQKEKIFLTLSDEKKTFSDVLEDRQESIEIQKNTWGYTSVQLRTEGDFLQTGSGKFTTDDFVGNTYRLDYVIQHDKLHAGYNYGMLFVETPYETLRMEIVVHQHAKKTANFGMVGMLEGQGLKQYLSYIAGKTDIHTWSERALACVEQLREANPENQYYGLLKAHVYLQCGREEEAKWVMTNLEPHRLSKGKQPEIQGYYLFLQALLRKEVAYTNKAVEEITRLYMKNPYCWQLLCMLVNLDGKYRDYSDRIRVYERQFSNGSNHVLMFADAYLCFRENVVLLRKFGAFEIQILDFATKYKILSKDLALYMADLVMHQKKYDKRLVRILKRAYRMYEEPRILQALCAQLINGNHTDEASFVWYQRAVKQELKIARVYEYYMMSMNADKVKGALPRIVYLYFLHGNQLDYKKTALLYANILTYEKEDSEIYQGYLEKMKAFAWEQLLKRHVNEQLRIIYNRFIKENEMGPEHFEALHDICYAYQIQTDRTDMKYVLVIEKDGSIRQRVPHKEDGAVVYLYDKEARIVFESKDGVHYTDSIPYDTKRLFYEIPFINLCRRYKSVREKAKEESMQIPVTFENLKRYGLASFDEQEVFLYCTKYIREQGYEEDDFLTFTCFELLKRGLYDKVLITYLCKFYCGATSDMKFVWQKAREYGVQAHELTERILTQMLFSEVMFREEAIFEDYCRGKAYFRLKQAYFAYVSREYVVKGREVDSCIFDLMLQHIKEKEYLADICKAALLKFYAGREAEKWVEEILHTFLRECCEQGMIFSFFLSYPKEWLIEVQLYDKVLLEYHAETDGKVQMIYQINTGDMENLDYQTETLAPVYENVYTKEFVLYRGEKLKYYFKESKDDKTLTSNRKVYERRDNAPKEGRFGRINTMLECTGEERRCAIEAFQQEEALANSMFPLA